VPRRLPARPAVAAALALAAATVLLSAPAAQAGCGGVQHRAARKHLTAGRAPLMIGDSVLLGAMPEVTRAGFEIDTRGCRGWSEGMNVLRARRHAGTLPPEVVVQLGTNFNITRASIRTALSIVGPGRVLVLLTPREVFGEDGADAAAVRAAGRAYPDRILVLDWVRHTRGHSSWFAPDGIHLSGRGAAGLARFLRTAARYAAGPPRRASGFHQDGRVAGHGLR
jgi:hypothetical protein